MRILVTGKAGQLGWELQRTLDLHPDNCSFDVKFVDSKELDITNQNAVEQLFSYFKPNLVINPAAYTAVDKAESEPEVAFAVNETGVRNIALACKTHEAKLIQISTDFVFDATKNTPYKATDTTNPLGVYGASKLGGEQHALAILQDNVTIVRTAWVYSVHGSNFVKAMLRLMQEKDQLGVVSDQIGTPTSAKNLALALWSLAERVLDPKAKTERVYHWTDLGTASWYDFAVAIQEIALNNDILKKNIPILPISSSEYPTPAKRPAYSVLDTKALRDELGRAGEHWRLALNQMIKELSS